MKQNPFDPTEDGGVGANPQGQANDGKKRKAGIAPQHPETKTNILAQLIWPHPDPFVARQLLELFDSTELPSGRGSRFTRGHADGDFAFRQ